MQKVHWFNPENDLALAAGATNYTPKRAARLLRYAGAVLPLWYADAGDQVLCYGVNAAWLMRIREDFGIEVGLFDHQPVLGQVPDPWGWSAYAKRFFLDQGFSEASMPTDTEIARYRALSHRRTSIALATRLHELLPDVPLAPPAVEVFSIDDFKSWVNMHPQAYLKFPWSSSGRGVFDVNSAPVANILKLADDSIRRQGSVMLEVAYDRVVDFARLFECRDGRCLDLGTSVFYTDEHDSYTGNLLGTESYLLSYLAEYCDIGTLHRVFDALRQCVEEQIAPYYNGILGIDMLIAKDGTVDAVVEVNLRRTMGYVARRFADMYLHPCTNALFRILPTSMIGDVNVEYTVSDHRLRSGNLLLTPQNQNFTYLINTI